MILFSICVLAIISCNENASRSEKEILLDSFKNTDNKNILGNWVMCSTSGNGIMTQLNVCPTISFKNDGTGSVANSSMLFENFNWSFKKGILTILYYGGSSAKTFEDTNYYAIIKKLNNEMDLTIREQKKDYSFYLSRYFDISNH